MQLMLLRRKELFESVPASIRETVREIVDNAVGKGSGEE